MLHNLLDKTGAKKVSFNFDVAGLVAGLEREVIEESGWMIRSHKSLVLNKLWTYPKLAQA